MNTNQLDALLAEDNNEEDDIGTHSLQRSAYETHVLKACLERDSLSNELTYRSLSPLFVKSRLASSDGFLNSVSVINGDFSSKPLGFKLHMTLQLEKICVRAKRRPPNPNKCVDRQRSNQGQTPRFECDTDHLLRATGKREPRVVTPPSAGRLRHRTPMRLAPRPPVRAT